MCILGVVARVQLPHTLYIWAAHVVHDLCEMIILQKLGQLHCILVPIFITLHVALEIVSVKLSSFQGCRAGQSAH